MLGIQQQKNLTKILAGGVFLISVAVMTEGLTDPVNVPKLLLLGVISSTLIGLLISFKLNITTLSPARVKFSLAAFMIFMVVAVLRSDLPLSQNIYGSYGRNNGFLTYLFLAILFFITSLVPERLNQLKIVKSLIYVGYVNLAYCFWVIVFGDFIPWNNPYGNILGTFGNPNFIGAFLGMFFGAMLAIGAGNEASRKFKIALVFLLPLTLFVIVDSSAIQGRVLAALSFGIVGIFFLYFNFSHRLAYLFTFMCVALGVVALAGAFQRGPLAELIYKTSVSLRGQYWLAAWNTGQENPLSGVGMDAFGDWYRRSRDARAIELPGINTVVNTAHNVPLDMFAFGGWPLFISYLTLMGVALKAAFGIARNMKSYDAVGVGLITTWTCYQVQSIISINQIGIAVWGWALSGGLIAYSRYAPELKAQNEHAISLKKPKIKSTNDLKPISVVHATLFGLVGLLVSLPPFSADAKLRSAQVSRDAIKLEKTMESSLFNPLNTQKYVINIQALETSGLFELSHKYALEAVEWNPESYELWRLLFLIRDSTEEEKQLAVRKMKTLDPLNPDVMATK
jgi:hypothetical protein